MESRTEGQLHSGLLCQALLRLVQSLGVTILNNIDITGYEKTGGHLLLHTQHSFPLIAANCSSVPTLLPASFSLNWTSLPARGQVLVTSPIDGLPFKGTFHFDEGFYYFRNLGERVLLGGARNRAFEEETTTDMTIPIPSSRSWSVFCAKWSCPAAIIPSTHAGPASWAWAAKKCPLSEP